MKRTNEKVNHYLKLLTCWVNASKGCLDTWKTENVLFKSARKESLGTKLKLNEKTFYFGK